MISKFNNTFGRLLGEMCIQDIKNFHIQSAITTLNSEGRASSSIKDALGNVTRCMEAAKNNNIIAVNPCFDIRLPWPSKKRLSRFLNQEEQEKFMTTAENNWYYEMFYVMFNTGLRVGEVGGLKWCDVDFNEKCIHVNQALSTNYVKGVKHEKLTTLKTPNSYRRIPFIGNVEEMLRKQKEKQKRLKKNLGERYRGKGDFDNLVFCTTMGSPITRYVAEKEINKVVDAINYEETFVSVKENREPLPFDKVYSHALRHTFCSRCFEKKSHQKLYSS
ncbi:MAG: tyrosine-type recombinase/integrase [Anaerostipes sp.]|nr:tyrosine-type recombinase/integrase [Anaerostipes sp.]